ncbi:MAG: VCBS repeat-containing protein [Akkermansiaceae bacterium]|nr:VCBS repeat-containing protein [Akkermansiaceae bacterium]
MKPCPHPNPGRRTAAACRHRFRAGRLRGMRIPLVVLVVAGAVFIAVRFLREAPSAAEPADPVAARVPVGPTPSWKQIDDPARDGWDTEVYAEKAKKQVQALGKLMAPARPLDPAAVAKLITGDFACGPIRPDDAATVLDDGYFRIDRAPRGDRPLDAGVPPPDPATLTHAGAEGLARALETALAPFPADAELRFAVKVFRVAAGTGEIATRQYVSLSGRGASGPVEQHATWDIGWARGDDGAPPRMRWLRVEEFEEAGVRRPDGPLFTDCTRSVLGANPSYANQFLRGLNHWAERLQDRSPFPLFGNPGLAVGDVNGDGLADLYVCQEGGLPNRLFLQEPDGSARDASAAWGVDWLESSRSALLVDLDNDGDQDLVVAILGGVVVAENDAGKRFALREVLECEDDTMSLSAVDYDLDGRLDLFVCAYNQGVSWEGGSGLSGAEPGFAFHDANNGPANSLFRNEISVADGWRFRDVTGGSGLDVNNTRWSYAASWEDFDNDGDQDLYVANDFGRDNFYRNDTISSTGTESPGSPFVDISDEARVEDSATGMAVTWGDYDRDGWMDAMVGNMWSSAGNRIAFQQKFRPDAPEEVRRRIQRLARGNTLLRNRGDGSFDDRSAPAGVEVGRWAWGSHFADLNNDGWEDLVVANGFITTGDSGDL